MGRRTGSGGVLLATLLLVAAASAAEKSPHRLDWVAPIECPQADEVRVKVESLLKGDDGHEGALVVRGTLTRAVMGYSLRLLTEIGDRRGERTLQDQSCSDLTSAAVLLIALALNPNFQPAAAASTEAPEPTVQEKASTSEVTEPLAPPRSASPPALRVEPRLSPRSSARDTVEDGGASYAEASTPTRREAWVNGALIADGGTLPRLASGAVLSVSGRVNWALLSLGATWLPGQSVEAPGGQGVSGRIDWIGADLGGCAGLWDWQLALGACAGISLGRLRGVSDGAGTPSPGSTPWVTPHLGLRARYRIRRNFALDSGAGALIALKSTSFIVENYASPVFLTPPLAFRAELGVSLRFW